MAIDLESSYTMTIGGRAVAGTATLDVVNPATGARWAEAPDASREQVDEAVAAARAAFGDWSRTSLAIRKAAILRMADRLESLATGLARLLVREQGKPLEQAQREVLGAVAYLRETCQIDVPWEQVVEKTPQRTVRVRRLPLGVVAAMVPWNFPVVLASWKIGPALLAGNTLVLKPSPFTPLTTLKIGEAFRDLLPPGVLNVVSGGDAVGPWLSAHPGVDKIAFTGSTVTGRRVMSSASDTLKRLTLELGGNDAAIVLPDVDVAEVAKVLFWTAFRNSGQVCIATKRVYIHEKIYDAFADALVALAKTVKLGDGLSPETQMGPIQNRRQLERLRRMLQDAREQGLRLRFVGEVPPGDGYFFPIVLVDDPPEEAAVVAEEAFGPILPLIKFRNVDDVVARVNKGPYGLGGSVWAKDVAAAVAVAENVQTGTVWINQPNFPSARAPLAGRRQSGVGSENGLEGILEYTAVQTLMVPAGQPTPQ